MRHRYGQLRAGAAAFWDTWSLSVCHHPQHCGFHPPACCLVITWWLLNLSASYLCSRQEEKRRPKGKDIFLAGLALFWEKQSSPWNFFLCHVATLATLETGTSSRLSSPHSRSGLRRWLERVLSKHPWVSATRLSITGLKVPWGHLPALGMGQGAESVKQEMAKFPLERGGWPGA